MGFGLSTAFEPTAEDVCAAAAVIGAPMDIDTAEIYLKYLGAEDREVISRVALQAEDLDHQTEAAQEKIVDFMRRDGFVAWPSM